MKPTCVLSAVIENQVRSLCLRDFPCGKGSWWGSASQESSDREGDTEEPAALIDLLTCLQSPWRYEGSWSAQAAALRELSVRKPECLSDAFVYTFFTSLRVVGQRVSVIDEGLLRFCKLEELVLCVNCISDIPLKHLPATLQVLELYANEISSLRGASGQQLPNLRHLGLGRNPLGSLEDMQYISSSIWPQLVSLDLSGCGFASLGGVFGGVASLAGLRVLSLEGNPLVLSPAYPGVLIDGLPRLLYLDGTRVTPDDRSAFRGMAAIKGLALDEAVVQVSVGPIRGVAPPPAPPRAGSSDFPLVSYNYRISYHFLTNQKQSSDLEPSDLVTEDQETGSSPQDGEMHLGMATANMCDGPNVPLTSMSDSEHSWPVLKHSSSAVPWAEVMDLKHSDTHRLSDLSALKSFLMQGLWITLEEEKITSWPASSSETPGNKSAVDKKASAKEDNAKKKKKEAVLELVQEAPVYCALGSAHLGLGDMAMGQHSVHVLCDYGVLDSTCKALLQQEQGKRGKEEKRKEEKKGKQGDTKGKGKAQKEGESEPVADDATCIPVQPVTVEISVLLHKWPSATQATDTQQRT